MAAVVLFRQRVIFLFSLEKRASVAQILAAQGLVLDDPAGCRTCQDLSDV